MDLATATLLVSGITSLMGAVPKIIEAIKYMDAPEATKGDLIARIRAAQAGLPVWE